MGGDYIHGRLLVAPLLATCAPVAVVPATRRFCISLLVVPWALLCAFTMRTSDGSPVLHVDHRQRPSRRPDSDANASAWATHRPSPDRGT